MPMDEIDWKRMERHYGCKECLTNNPIECFSQGDIVCGDCGLVLDNHIIEDRAEWRTFTGDNDGAGADPNRVGDGPSEHFSGGQLTTKISDDKVSSMGLIRAQKQNTMCTEDDKVNQQLQEYYQAIDAYCGAAHFTREVQDMARMAFRMAWTKKIFKKNDNDTPAQMAAVLHNACKRGHVARSMGEIAKLCGVNRKSAQKLHSKLEQMMQKHDLEADLKAGVEVHGLGIADADYAKATRTASPPPNAGAASPPRNARADSSEYNTRTGSPPRETPGSPTGASAHVPMAVQAKDLFGRNVQNLNHGFWFTTLGGHIADAIQDTQVLDARSAETVAPTILFILSALIDKPVDVATCAKIFNRAGGTVKTAVNLTIKRKDELIKNKYWPNDSRINMNLFPLTSKVNNCKKDAPSKDNATAASAAQKKRKAEVSVPSITHIQKEHMPMQSKNKTVLTTSEDLRQYPVYSPSLTNNTGPVPATRKKPLTKRFVEEVGSQPNRLVPATSAAAPKANKENAVYMPTPPPTHKVSETMKRKATGPIDMIASVQFNKKAKVYDWMN